MHHEKGAAIGEEDSTDKQETEEDATEQVTELTEEDRSSGRNKSGNRFTPKLSKNSKEVEVETEQPSLDATEPKIENPVQRAKLFSTSERAPSHFVPKVKLGVEPSATTTQTSTTLTTSTTTLPSTDETTRRKNIGKELLSSIPLEDDVSALLPPGYVLQPETSSSKIVQVHDYFK